MSKILTASPGTQCTVFLETFNGLARANCVTLPSVVQILFPNLVPASGYPQFFTHIGTGLYTFAFSLPTGATSVGSYLVDVTWPDPATGNPAQTYYQVIVSAPRGNYSVTTG
jgi:hypothetical protein